MSAPETAPPVVWQGPDSLRQFLVPIDSLEPWPGNPRRGDVTTVRSSLARFGQVRPILVDGARIVAGHHVVLAAGEEGWTHIAAIPNQFENEEEARAYLLADNRSSELGSTDDALLGAQLRALADSNASLEGIGYDDETAARLVALAGEPVFLPSSTPPPPLDERVTLPGYFEVPLKLDPDQRRDFTNWVGVLRREWGLDSTLDVVLRAVREAAANQ